jgi:hypothetical protein
MFKVPMPAGKDFGTVFWWEAGLEMVPKEGFIYESGSGTGHARAGDPGVNTIGARESPGALDLFHKDFRSTCMLFVADAPAGNDRMQRILNLQLAAPIQHLRQAAALPGDESLSCQM